MLVYYMDVSQLDINQTQHSVSLDRIKKTARYIHQKDKKLSIGAELLLKYSLNQINIFNPVISHDQYGKPFLVNHPRVHFNLSHSEEYVACAVSDSPVGVDIERVREIELDIARHYFFGSEYQQIQDSPHQLRTFYQFWVLKESYMKMTGLGFRLGLDEFSIKINNSSLDNNTPDNNTQDNNIQKNNTQKNNTQDSSTSNNHDINPPDNIPRIEVQNRNYNTHKQQSGKNPPEFGVWSVAGDDYMLAVCSEGKINQKISLKPNLISLNDLLSETKRETMEIINQHQRGS